MSTLVPIKSAPSSSRWNFRGVRNGFEFWSANSQKTFAKEIKTGNWFKVVTKTPPPVTVETKGIVDP